MKQINRVALGVAAGLLTVSMTTSAAVSDYTVAQLLEPCVEGDNDSREGAAAEAECEQYIKGFTDAYASLTEGGKADSVCLPEQNRLDEVRWAFMRWAYKYFDDRNQPAADGLLAVIKESFACK